ncbi:hypothetical protein [Flavobacterium sp.]|uniref:hypothetical protein n=1 Tax=Flavobacterium sp. TaxID=239 RepID=UPI002C53ED05|nr:hypothetical protein [Flavobacterium sp.]HSD06651.1 hypothetical protein [Flavobacterium sp.]
MSTIDNNSDQDQSYRYDSTGNQNDNSSVNHSITENAEPDYANDLVTEGEGLGNQGFNNENLGQQDHQDQLNNSQIDKEYNISGTDDEFDEDDTDNEFDNEELDEDEFNTDELDNEEDTDSNSFANNNVSQTDPDGTDPNRYQ